MLVTRFTYPFRAIAAVGFLVALGGVFAPFVTFQNGGVDPYQDGDSPSGWELANLDKNKPLEQNIIAMLFVFDYAFVILGPLGALFSLLGRDARGMAMYLAYIGGFLLVTALVLLPTLQESIPVPQQPPECTAAALQDTLDQYGQAAYDAQKAQCDQVDEPRKRILAAKAIRLAPAAGLFIVLAGAVAAYVGARLVAGDESKRQKMDIYVVFLKEAHKDGKISREEEELLALERRLHGITREDHELSLRHLFPDPQQFEYAVYQHQNPIDIDRMILEKHLQNYETFLAQAYRKGDPTDEEMEMLAVIRRQVSISPADHDMILTYLIQEGRIPMPKRYGPGWGTGGRSMPAPPAEEKKPAERPRSAHVPPPAPPPVTPTETRPARAERRSPPPTESAPEPPPSPKAAPAEVPRPARPKPAPTPEPAPAKAPPAEEKTTTAAAAAAPARRVRCPKCRYSIEVASEKRPMKLECPGCHYTGTLK